MICVLGRPGGGQKWWKTIMFYCVSVNLRSELLRFHMFYVYFSILVRFWPGHKSKKFLFYCRNVMFWAHPGSPKGGSRGASGRPFWDPKKLQKHCFCCVFGDGEPKKLIKPVVFLYLPINLEKKPYVLLCAWPARGGQQIMKNHYVLLRFSEFEVGIITIPYVLFVFIDFYPFLARSQIPKVIVLLTKCYVLGPPRIPQRGVQGRLREAVLRPNKVAKALFLLCI